jgi:hypothetical protein
LLAECAVEGARRWRKANRKHLTKYMRRWRDSNGERLRAYRAQRYADNPAPQRAAFAMGSKEPRPPAGISAPLAREAEGKAMTALHKTNRPGQQGTTSACLTFGSVSEGDLFNRLCGLIDDANE